MTEPTRRQIGTGALAVLASSSLPIPIATILASNDTGDAFERMQADCIRDVAELAAEFRRVDRDFFVDPYARATWCLAHYELATQSQVLRNGTLGDSNTKRAIRSWIDTLYPSPAVRAWHVQEPLTNLSHAFAERQVKLDAVTDELGAAEYQGALYRRRISLAAIPGERYWTLTQTPVTKLLTRQGRVSASFAGLTVETRDDKTALHRAMVTCHSDFWVRKLNARRTWRLRHHA